MGPLIDTSAVIACLDGGDPNADDARRILASCSRLVPHAYVVVESISVIDRRLPPAAMDAFLDVMLPTIQVSPVGPELFSRAMAAFRARERRRLSFVDAVTIEFCRSSRITDVFAFDDDLARAGLQLARG